MGVITKRRGSFALIGCVVLAAACAAPAADSGLPAEDAETGETEEIQMEALRGFAQRYTDAWNSQDAAQVADFYAEGAALTVNGGAPHVGRAGIIEVASGFMTAFPDMVIHFDSLEQDGERVNFHWTFEGTNTGEGGTGQRVDFSGYESWLLGEDGLIADSLGNYDAEEYARQLEHGVDASSSE